MVGLIIEPETMEAMATNTGATVLELSYNQPILLIFLRHFGCTFCREALTDIARHHDNLEQKGTKVVFVHMTDNETAERYFSRYELAGATHVSDPACRFYAAFGLVKGNFTQLFGLRSWIRGFQSAVVEGNGVGLGQVGDGFQMPGVFVIQGGEIREAFIHKLSHDRPDYLRLVEGCCEVPGPEV